MNTTGSEPQVLLVHSPASLECSTCGYGIVRPTPPDRCPMCQQNGPWVHSRRQPSGGRPA